MIFDDTFIEIRGNKEVLIDGFGTLLKYSESEIAVIAGKKKLAITVKQCSSIFHNTNQNLLNTHIL